MADLESPLETLQTQLKDAKGPVLFSDLAAHLARGSVFIVAADISLEECALAIATDNVAKVKALLAAEALRKPTSDEVSAWAAAAGGRARTWEALVVQPYVLIQ